jgi:MerR family transcriptional regulator, copper efflux regulator
MRITEAAQRLGTSPRMLRYREALGLLPPMSRGAGRAPGHRRFGDQDVAAVALALDLERRLDISPAALAFGLRVLAEPGVRAQVADLGRRIGRVPPPPGSALDFEKERALRLLSMGHRPVRAAPPVPRPAAQLPAGGPAAPVPPSARS